MATFKRLEEIEAWQKARILTREIYDVSKQGLFAKDFALRDQVRRASVSVMANIAEGYERGGTKEFIQFLAIAKGSVGELRTYLYIALDQAYLNQESFERLFHLSIEIARLIAGLMNYLQRSVVKGTKYKRPLLTRQPET